jgi:hypothetical protein
MLWDDLVTSLSTLIIMNSQSLHSNSETIHVNVCICVLLSVAELKEGYLSSWAQFQSGIDSGFCLLLLQSFGSWPRHLWGAWISSKSWHDWLQRSSADPVYDGVSRTWTDDGNWIWHSLTNSGTIWLMPDWYQRDLGGIWLYTIDLFLGLGFQQQIVNQCVGGTPELVTKARKRLNSSSPSKGMCKKELGRYEHIVEELHNFSPKANPHFLNPFGQHPFAPRLETFNFYMYQCLLVWHRLLNTLSLVLVLCPRPIFGWSEAWNMYVIYA